MITIITGDRDSGKTTKVKEMLKQTVNAGGFISEKRFVRDMAKTDSLTFDGYDVLDIKTGIRERLLSINKPALTDTSEELDLISTKFESLGSFKIEPKGVTLGITAIEHANITSEIIIMDELGQAELNGRMFRSAFESALNSGLNLILVIRKELLLKYQTEFPQLAQAKIIETKGE